MAQSPSHKFGQIIGDFLEEVLEPLLQDFADRKGLYLDKVGVRKARRGKKVSWIDKFGNKHDLDFVLEREGSETEVGSPVAFIEAAWRRYTKHSRNKSQEIQGAILPLFDTYSEFSPFLGVLLRGVFTDGAIKQLESLGFSVLYIEYESIVNAFNIVGLDASFGEDTPVLEFQQKVAQWEALNQVQKNSIATELKRINQAKIDSFLDSLENTVDRTIENVLIIPLHGNIKETSTIKEAIDFISTYTNDVIKPIIKYEIIIKYSNGDKINAEFSDKPSSIRFLNQYL
jgi:hypothetical protein